MRAIKFGPALTKLTGLDPLSTRLALQKLFALAVCKNNSYVLLGPAPAVTASYSDSVAQITGPDPHDPSETKAPKTGSH